MALFESASVLALPGIRHGFSLRTGGVSAAPFESLNLARTVGDEFEAVAENHQRLADAVGYAPDHLYEVSQVHGARVIALGEGDLVQALRLQEADALVSALPGRAVAVRVADCLPVLLADPEARVIGAAHAGWRGVEAGVLGATLDAMAAAGARAERTLAALGPHIGSCCFEVGTDVARRIADASECPSAIVPREPRPYVALAVAVRAQLSRLGLPEGNQAGVGGCTACDAGRYFSYRRDAGQTGRLLAVIALD